MSFEKLKRIAYEIRCDVIQSLAEAGSGHLGGSLGLADIFTALYFHHVNHAPKNPEWEFRDRVVLSIGHVAPVLYATLAHAGYFHRHELFTLRQLNSRLQGHPSRLHGLPGVETSSGSLGQGLSIGVGMALAAKMDNKNNFIYVILGDGEIQEGNIWEAAMSASFYKLDNLIAIVDRNYKQIDGNTEEVMALEPLRNKWESFGWYCAECDGNDIKDVVQTISKLKFKLDKPKVILAKTVMGKGVRSIENDYTWHGKAPTPEQAQQFLKELAAWYIKK